MCSRAVTSFPTAPQRWDPILVRRTCQRPEPSGLRSVIDVTGGASGGGLLENIFSPYYGDPTWYWVGGCYWRRSFDCQFSKLDWNMLYFIRDNCTEY